MRLWLPVLLVGCSPTPDPIHIAPGGGLPVQPQFLEELDAASNAEILDSVYDGSTIWDFEIYLDQPAIDALIDAPKEWVVGDFAWNGLLWEDVGVRLKGNGSFQGILQRPSVKVKFDHLNPEGDFFGQDMLVFNNMGTDATKIRERVAYQMYREMGIPAVRANHATFRIAGEDKGIYMVMEDVDRDMIQQWFTDDQGSLFELFDADFQPELVELFQLEFGPDDRTLIQGAADALTLSGEEALVEVENYIEMEQFLAYYATTGMLGQFDAYPFSVPGDDIHWYADPTTQRLHPIPHGLDESFQQEQRHMALPIGLLASTCYFDDGCRIRLAEHYWRVNDQMQLIDLYGFAQQTIEDIRPVLQVDPFFFDDGAAINIEQALLLEFLLDREARLVEDMGVRP